MILHIVQREAWQAAERDGALRPATLQSEGFIHCSTPEQVLGPANALFRGQEGLVLLCIAPQQVEYPIVYEDCYATGMAYPHIYGPLSTAAVVRVIDFQPGDDGTFVLPAALLDERPDLSEEA